MEGNSEFSTGAVNPQEASNQRDPLSEYLTQKGVQLLRPIQIELKKMIAACGGINRVSADNLGTTTLTSGGLNTRGIGLLDRLTSSQERMDAFLEAMLASRVRGASLSRTRPDLLLLTRIDAGVIQAAFEGKDSVPPNNIAGMDEQANVCVHDSLRQAFSPETIDGAYTLVDQTPGSV